MTGEIIPWYDFYQGFLSSGMWRCVSGCRRLERT